MRIFKLAALSGTVALVAMIFSGVAGAAPAQAAPIASSCGYADATGGGKFPSSICWLDFTGYDPALGATAAGQEFEMSLGEYDVSYSVTQRPIPGWNSRSVVAAAATAPPFMLGVPGFYNGIPGKPFLYATADTRPSGAVQINIQNFKVTLDGSPVTGYELVSAAPETLDPLAGQHGEWIGWKSDQPLTVIDHRPVSTSGGGCVIPMLGDGTTIAWCDPRTGSTQSTAYGAILSAPSATNISGFLYMSSRNEREALGFGIRTARVTLDKQVTGRVDPNDSFDLSVTADEGPTLGAATTGVTDAATTGSLPVIPSGPVTLSESVSSSSPSPLGYYDAVWSCTNATAGSTTVLPSGSEPSQQLTLAAGDAVTCKITNTAKASALTLVKSVSPATASVGDTVTYKFLVSNTGQLPVDNLAIDEISFNGSGALSGLACPVQGLDVGEETTCQATYTVTQADVDAGTILNDAAAGGVVESTTRAVVSNTSSAELTTGGTPMLTVAKTVDKPTANVGDTVRYTLTATNDGELTLHDVTLKENGFTGSVPLGATTCDRPDPVTLAPGQRLTCTVSYEARTADVGTITNGVIGAALDPQDNKLGGNASADVRITALKPGGLSVTGEDASWIALGSGVLLLLVGATTMISLRARRS